MRTLRHFLRVATALTCAALLSSCANLAGPREVELPLSKLQAAVDKRFPRHNRIMELFDIQLSRPQVLLLADSGRVGLAMDAAIAPPLLKQSWRGTMALSGRLYIDNARGAVMMAEPHVDRFAIEGVDGTRQRQLEQAANVLMGQLVSDVPIYSFDLEKLRYAGVQFLPTRIAATASGLRVTLEPVK